MTEERMNRTAPDTGAKDARAEEERREQESMEWHHAHSDEAEPENTWIAPEWLFEQEDGVTRH